MSEGESKSKKPELARKRYKKRQYGLTNPRSPHELFCSSSCLVDRWNHPHPCNCRRGLHASKASRGEGYCHERRRMPGDGLKPKIKAYLGNYVTTYSYHY